MLNELYQFSNTLEKQGLLPHASTHRDVHKMAKCPCLYIQIDRAGRPASLRLLDKKETARLWLHSKGNHCRFPAIKVQKPLLAESVSVKFEENIWKKADLEKKREMLLELDYTVGNPESDDIQIKPWTLEQMKPVIEDMEDERLEGVRLLLNRFPRKENSEAFYAAFRQLVRDRIWDADKDTAEFLKKLLVGEYQAKGNQYTAGCACYFDIRELSKVAYAVADPDTEKAVIESLLSAQAGQAENDTEEKSGISALSGTRMPLVQDKYPNPKMQVIGPAYLYSNNTGAIPCLSRYGLEGTKAFPAGEEQVRKMSDALGFLMEDERKDFTWTSFWGTTGKQPLLLLAWMEDDPRSDAKLAAAVGDEGGTSVYEHTCKRVLDLLRQKLDADRDEPVHLQLFEILDTGRKQIAYSRTMNVSELYKNVEDWLEASKNVPPVIFQGDWKNREGQEIRYMRPYCPGPGAVSRLLRIQYRTQKSNKVGQMMDRRSCLLTEEEVYRLFLPDTYGGRKDDRLIETCMKEILRTCGDLLFDAARFQTLYEKHHPFREDSIRRTCEAVKLLGILLCKKGIRKEQYMNSKMFLLGRYLKLADRLHENYCIIVRNHDATKKNPKSLPGELMGSAVYPLAMQKPEAALERLSLKMKIYLDWARTDSESQSKWILNLMEKTITEMSSSDSKFPERPTASDKVELIYGYMGELPYCGKKQDDAGKKAEGSKSDEKEVES